MKISFSISKSLGVFGFVLILLFPPANYLNDCIVHVVNWTEETEKKYNSASIFHSWPFIPLETISCIGLGLRLLKKSLLLHLDYRLAGAASAFLQPDLPCQSSLTKWKDNFYNVHSFPLQRGSFFWQTSGWCNKLFHSQNVTTGYLNTAFQMKEVISGCCRTTRHLVECPTTKPECFVIVA